MPWLLNFKAWCSLTEALKYLVVASMIAGLVLPRVWKIKSISLFQEDLSFRSVHTAPISPTAVLFSVLLVSWPGWQNDEVSREVIPICRSDYFPNSHLILPTTHQQGARERKCGSCSHRRGGEDKRGWGSKRKKINKETNSKHIRGERQRFQFLVDEKSTMISPMWSEVLFPFSANHLETAKQLAALGCCPTRGHVLTQMRLPYLTF